MIVTILMMVIIGDEDRADAVCDHDEHVDGAGYDQ